MCARNNEKTLQITLDTLHSIEKNNQSTFKYYIYENDSEDKTKHIIKNFYKNHKGNFQFQTIGSKFWDSVYDLSRSNDMSIYRNKMKALCTDFTDSDYSIILDTNITFTEDTFVQMKKILDTYDDIHMVTPYGHSRGNPKFYYDAYALDIKSKYYGNTVKKLNMELKHSNSKIVKVKSAFAGFIMIRTDTLRQCDWGVSGDLCSEHNWFCKEVSNFGNVVCAGKIKVSWIK